MNFLFINAFLFLFACLQASAEPSLQKLSTDPQWLSLIHSSQNIFGRYQSSIRSKKFFLSENGSHDPEAELKATIESLLSPVEAKSEPDGHAQCRFPARALWLKRVAPSLLKDMPQVSCAGFQQFSFRNNIESVSLIFATGYLSNPASFFGHPLIKFNLPRSQMPSNLLDVSVNYGAITPPQENGFVYAFKGLFGGYDATFTHRQFYYNSHAYGELELRDMWEYRLNLNPDEVKHIVAHTWELLGQLFPYVFLTENCATAMAEMIASATGIQLIPSYYPYSLPITVFDNLARAKRSDGTPLMASVTLVPSRQTRLTSRYNNLDEASKAAVQSVAKTNEIDAVQTLPDPEKKSKAIEALFDYYSFKTINTSDQQSDDDVKRKLLLERLRLPPARESEQVTGENLSPPHKGQLPLLTRMGYLRSQTHGEGFEFHFRTAYYDLLALDYGRSKNSSVLISDLALHFFDHKVWLHKWDLISIETLNLSQTGLPGDGGYAWNFSTGFEAVHLACENCAVFKVESGVGKAVGFLERQVVYAMVSGRVQSAAEGSGHFAGTPKLGILLDPFKSGIWRMDASYSFRQDLYGDKKGQSIYRVENRFGLNQKWDIRASFHKHDDDLWKLSFSRYW